MSHFVLGSNFLGNHISRVIEEAKSYTDKHETVEFDFNGIKCIVNSSTVPEYLERDFLNAHIMGWSQVGPECVPWYDTDTEIELYSKKLEAAKRRKKEEDEYEKKRVLSRENFETKVAGVTLELKEEAGWSVGKNKNTDSYGACIYEYAEGWAKLMQIEITKGHQLFECAERTSFEMDFLGITGFMYGAAVNVLSHCWKYGEDLRKWHNKQYNHDGEGVVNLAVITIKD